jgi:hypothetical protein
VTRATSLVLAVLIGVPPIVAAPADAARADEACARSCRQATAQCLKDARARRARLAATCAGTPAERRPCKRAAKAAFKASRTGCRAFRATCRACCRDGGTDCANRGDEPLYSGTYTEPSRDVLETLPLPPAPDGSGFAVLATPTGTFAIDPAARTPVSAAAECAALVLSCFRANVRNWAGCFESVRVCPTDAPWEGNEPVCCPAGCAVRFQELRRAGLGGPAAATAAIWRAPSCVPGLGATAREVVR